MYSQATDYAIQALIHLAQIPEGEWEMSRNIATRNGLPQHFLAKVLQDLVRRGVLRSSKGPSGGFALQMQPCEISLLYVVDLIDGAGNLRLKVLSDEVRQGVIDYLAKTTIADLVDALETKRAEMREAA